MQMLLYEPLEHDEPVNGVANVIKPAKFYVDGCEVSKKQGFISDWYIHIYDEELCDRIIEHRIHELPDLHRFSLKFDVDLFEIIHEVIIMRNEGNGNLELAFEYYFDWELWKKPYSIIDFHEMMGSVISGYEKEGIRWVQTDESVSNGCQMIFEVIDLNNTIQQEIDIKLEILKEIQDKAILNLHLLSNGNSVTSLFDFHESVRVPCEQYLLYFAQFLRNVGVEVTADIHHEASKVLFSVTPTSEHTALEQIHHALSIYLQIPSVIASNMYLQSYQDPRIQQLVANIYHLNGQLVLSDALVKAKDHLIQQQQILIEQQQKYLDATIIKESLIYASDGNKVLDKEAFFNGAIALTKYQGKGFEVDLPGIYRKVKNIFLGE